MQISLADFRSFHQTGYIDVKPVNLIVGENSSGKTSFLAAIRFVYSLFSDGVSSSLNQYPYFLGSYEDIAHFRGGRFGRAPKFTISIKGDLTSDEIERSIIRYSVSTSKNSKQIEEARPYVLDITFYNYRSQPRVKTISFRSGRHRFSVDVTEKSPKFSVRTPSINEELSMPSVRYSDPESLFFNLSYLRFMLTDLIFYQEHGIGTNVKNEISETFRSEMISLAAYYTAAQSQIGRDVYATAPVRTEPRRIYNPADVAPTTEGDNAPILLAQMSAFDSDKWERLKAGLDRFGKASGLFSSINVKHLARSKTGPFQISISVGKVKSSIVDVGYGVSQVLPIIYELLVRENKSAFLFQQPEVHLHPKAQAELASFMVQSAREKGFQLFIETHSDYIVDRIRMDVRDSKGVGIEEGVNILYFKKSDLDTKILQMGISRDGTIIGAPPGYREFFLREKARSIGIK
jgi:AAA15 family ATPase/GTPase